jgi:prepilin-type N-terminal cleavage/methylation domain-containing protein
MKNKNGFTLVELMISISIIAILSVVLSISFSKAQKSGRDQRRITDLKAVQSAAEQMVLLSGTYPVSVNFYKITSPSWAVGAQVVLNKFPADPKYNYVTNVGDTYAVSNISSSSYCICAQMESSKGNAESNQCAFTNSNGYFCIKNQQ